MQKRNIILMILFLGLIGLFYFPNPSRVSADLPTGPILGTDFESGLNGWTTTGDWHIENNAISNFTISGIPSPDHYMWLGDNRTGFGNYSSNDGTLTSPIFDLTEKGRVEFSFYYWKDMNVDNNMVWVDISPDGGATWYPLLWSQGTAGNLPDNTGFVKITLPINVTDYYLRTSSVQIRFEFIGDLWVNDTAGYSGWRIDDIEIIEYPEFYIDIYPEGIHAKTLSGEQQRLYFRVNNLFSLVQTVDLTINITAPSGDNDTIYDQPVTIAHSTMYGSPYWDYEHFYTFPGDGKYNVTLIIVDEMNNKHSKTVIWEVGPYLEIMRTDLQYYALQGQTRTMEFIIFNYFNYTVYADISIVIETPSGVEYSIAYMINEAIPSLSSPPDYDAYNFTVDCSFIEDGQNWVHANVSYLGNDYLGDSSFWEVGPYFDIKYEFDQYMVLLGEYVSFEILIDPYLFADTEVNISITVETPSSSVINLFEISNQLFSPSGPLSETWTDSFSYQALEPGSHTVRIEVINVTDPSALWYDLWDNVFNFYVEEADPTLLITQTNKYPDLGDSQVIDFSIQSHYAFDIVVDISIVMTTPNGDEIVLHEEASTQILAVDSWETSITYNFDEYGLYNVELLVVNGTGTEWSVRSSYRVREPESSDTDKVSPSFEVILVTATLVFITILSRKRRD